MSLIDRLPTRRPRPQAKHRAVDEVERLKLKLQWANALIRTQCVQLDDAEAVRAWTATQQATAEELVVKLQADVDDLTAERDGLLGEVAALKARFAPELAADANATAITVPCGYRDTSAIEDQATGPINVQALWTARDAGLLGPVLDPGHATTP